MRDVSPVSGGVPTRPVIAGNGVVAEVVTCLWCGRAQGHVWCAFEGCNDHRADLPCPFPCETCEGQA